MGALWGGARNIMNDETSSLGAVAVVVAVAAAHDPKRSWLYCIIRSTAESPSRQPGNFTWIGTRLERVRRVIFVALVGVHHDLPSPSPSPSPSAILRLGPGGRLGLPGNSMLSHACRHHNAKMNGLCRKFGIDAPAAGHPGRFVLWGRWVLT